MRSGKKSPNEGKIAPDVAARSLFCAFVKHSKNKGLQQKERLQICAFSLILQRLRAGFNRHGAS